MNNKEFKEYWSSKTLGELKGYISQRIEMIQIANKIIKENAKKIVELDVNSKRYISELTILSNSIKSQITDIKEDEKRLEILNPIFEKKELKGIDQTEYETYMTNNQDNIKVLIKSVEDLKEQKRETLKDELDMNDEEINEVHEDMLKELIMIIKDNAGNIEKVESLKYNNHKGFDCTIKGDKGIININTIQAGGYNIQKLHYRTLVQRY